MIHDTWQLQTDRLKMRINARRLLSRWASLFIAELNKKKYS